MQISSSTYIAVETLAHLAAQGADTPCTTQSLAQWMDRPLSYTETLLERLRSAGLIKANKGSGGGYCLARPAHQIAVAEIFRVFDGPDAMCGQLVGPSALSDSDRIMLNETDLLWEALNRYILRLLEDVSLAHIAATTDEAIQAAETDEALVFGRYPVSYTRH